MREPFNPYKSTVRTLTVMGVVAGVWLVLFRAFGVEPDIAGVVAIAAGLIATGIIKALDGGAE